MTRQFEKQCERCGAVHKTRHPLCGTCKYETRTKRAIVASIVERAVAEEAEARLKRAEQFRKARLN